MRVAIIGCGAIARTHADAVIRLGENIVALCDKELSRAEKLRDEHGLSCPVFCDYEQMLDEIKPDVVHICTPHFLHVPMSIAALKRNISVLSEKPVCVSYEQYLELVEAEEKSTANFAVCFQNRYNAVTKGLQRALENETPKGIFATVSWDRGERYYTSTDWRGRKPREGGGVMMNQAIHTLDLTLLLLGEPLAVTGTVGNHHLQGVIDEEDVAEFLIEFRNGARATFYATTANAFNAPVTITLSTDKNLYSAIGTRLFDKDFNELAANISDGANAKDYWGTGHELLIRDFYAHIAAGKDFPIGAKEAYRAVSLIDAVYRSNGQRILL